MLTQIINKEDVKTEDMDVKKLNAKTEDMNVKIECQNKRHECSIWMSKQGHDCSNWMSKLKT